MPQGFMKIVSRPRGGAPPEIRDQWLGLVLPVEEPYEGPIGDVMTGHLVDFHATGYAVEWNDAMEALEKKSPEAAEWWRRHVRPMTLIFDPDCAELLPD